MSDPAPQSDAELEELVLRALDALEADPAAVDRLCAERPEHAARLRARIDALEGAGLLGGEREDALAVLTLLAGLAEHAGRTVFALELARVALSATPGDHPQRERRAALVERLATASNG